MSYIVAFVRFAASNGLYPVNCWRSDVKEGDSVVVRMNNRGGSLQWAMVEYLTHFNWDCANNLECLASEAEFTSHGIIPPNPPKIHHGINRPIDVWHSIRNLGWQAHRTRSKSYKFACSVRNRSSLCYLFFRKNGTDLQIMDLKDAPPKTPDIIGFSLREGHTERSDCRNTEENFYVYIASVAKALSEDLDYRVVPRPSLSKRYIPWAAPGPGGDETNWRDAFKGIPGPVYLSDSQYL